MRTEAMATAPVKRPTVADLIERADVPRVSLYAAVAYITIFTTDATVAGVPLKAFVVAVALCSWYVDRRQHVASPFAFTVPVLALGVVLPLVWTAVALLLGARGDPAQHSGGHYAIQEASHFFYLLLYFPIVDVVRTRPAEGGHRVWLAPVMVLCIVTWCLYLAHFVPGVHLPSGGKVGPFQGVIGSLQSGGFRVFIANDSLMLPAAALLFASLSVLGVTRNSLIALALVVSAAGIAKARAIWLGIGMGVLLVLALGPLLKRIWLARAILTVFAGVLVGSVVLGLAPGLVRSFSSSASDAYRFQQAPLLWHAFGNHPILGSGFGATLPNGYLRSPDAPWSFELTYVQVLFESGVVGFAAILALPAVCMYRCARMLTQLHDRDLALAQAAIATVAGLLVATGTNPFLLSSFGMLTLAIALAMADDAMAGIQGRAPGSQPKHSVSRDHAEVWPPPGAHVPDRRSPVERVTSRLLGRQRAAPRRAAPRHWLDRSRMRSFTLLSGRMTLAIEVATAVIAVVGIALYTTVFSPRVDALRLVVARTQTLSPHLQLTPRSTVTTDPALSPADAPLWVLTRQGKQIAVSEMALRGSGPPTVSRFVANVGPAAPGESFAVAPWQPSGAALPSTPYLFKLRTLRSALAVSIYALSTASARVGSPSPVLAVRTALTPKEPGDYRKLVIAPWGTSGRSALFVVDYGLPLERPLVRIFSGESRFSNQVAVARLPVRGVDPGSWSLIVGPLLGGPYSDIVLASHRAARGHSEIVVLSSTSGFQQRIADVSAPWPGVTRDDVQVMLGGSNQRPAIYALDLHRPPGVLLFGRFSVG